MAEYDGSIRIGTGIDKKGFEAGSKDLEKEARRMTESIADTLGEGAKIALQKQTDAFVKLNQRYADQVQKVKDLGSELHDLQRTQVETPIFKETSKELSAAEKKLDNLYGTLRRLEHQGKTDTKPYKDAIVQIDIYKKKVSELQNQLKELKQSGEAYQPADTSKVQQKLADAEQKQMQMYTALQTAADSLTQKTSERVAKEEVLREKISAEAAEEQRLDQIRVNAVATNDQIIAKVERLKQLEQEIADLKKVNKTEGYADYDNRIKEASKLRQDIREYNNELTKTPEKFENMRKSAKKAFDAVSGGTKKSSGLISTLVNRMKGLALSLLIFNWISKGFNAMISGMKVGFTNFAGYSDSYAQSIQNMKNAMSTLGNQFAAAFAPIVQMVIPWINSLINVLTTAMTYVAQFFAVLSGKSTFTKAKKVQDSYNKSLGGTAKAADKARGALAKFDDLDVLEKKDDAGGGGGGGAGEDFGDMFEEVPVDYKVQTWLDGIIDRLNVLKGIFSKGFWDGLGDWGARWESIKESISSIKENLIDIWTDPAVVSSAQAWSESVIYMLGALAGSVTSIGLTIAANILGGIETYLDENKDRIKGFLVSMFDIGTEVNNMFSELFSSIAFVFEAFASEQGQQLTANIIGIFVDAFMGITELASKFFRDLAQLIIKPFVDNKEGFRTALEGFLGVLAEVTGTIKQGIDDTFDKLNEVYDTHFKPFFDSVAQGLSDLVGSFLEFWNGQVQPILNKWAEGFDLLWQEHIQPMIDNFIELLGQAADFLKAIWENVIMPFIEWIIENILPVILPIIDGVVTALMGAADGIADTISGIIKIFTGLIEFVLGAFTGDWSKAWDGIAKIVEGVKDTIKGIINGILGGIEGMANGVVKAINKIIESLNGLSFDIPDWVPGFGGESLGFNISTISPISIPRLATGAVIRGGNPFMAILGDQPAGKTNIEAPLSTIEQAVENVISRNGYGRESVPVNINLTWDGETFARLSISDILSELDRQGFNVDVLGVT